MTPKNKTDSSAADALQRIYGFSGDIAENIVTTVIDALSAANGAIGEPIKPLYGPNTHVCWTPDRTPKEDRVQVVLITQADLQRANAALTAEKRACPHRLADVRNPIIKSGYMCVDCGDLFGAADHTNEKVAEQLADDWIDQNVSGNKVLMQPMKNIASASDPDVESGAVEELGALPWLDESTADSVEKARRVLKHIIEPSLVYYFEDGFPRPELKQQAKNCLAVLNALAGDSADETSGKPAGQSRGYTAQLERRVKELEDKRAVVEGEALLSELYYIARENSKHNFLDVARAALAAEKVTAEPVAWTTADRLKRIAERNQHVDTMWPASMRDKGDIPLFTAPQPAQTQVALMDDERVALEAAVRILGNGNYNSRYAETIRSLLAAHPAKKRDDFVFPPMPPAIVMHEKVGPLFDRLSMQFYASKCIDLATDSNEQKPGE